MKSYQVNIFPFIGEGLLLNANGVKKKLFKNGLLIQYIHSQQTFKEH